MKKILYYASPFVLIPVMTLLCEWLDDSGAISMSPWILGGILLLFCLGMGLCSPARGRFDSLLTALMPAAFFCVMFVGGFLDKDDLETRFHLSEALSAALQPFAILLYCLMALVSFFASWQAFRKK